MRLDEWFSNTVNEMNIIAFMKKAWEKFSHPKQTASEKNILLYFT